MMNKWNRTRISPSQSKNLWSVVPYCRIT
jgi:hypothetical protein